MIDSNYSLKIRTYKCFLDVEQGFEKILPLNIIIGKNNSGKSSLIDLIEYLIEPTETLLNSKGQIILNVKLSEEFIENIARKNAELTKSSSLGHINSIKENLKDFVGSDLRFLVKPRESVLILSEKIEFGQYKDAVIEMVRDFYRDKFFKRINAERDILPDWGPQNGKLELAPDGKGATGLIKQIVHHSDYKTQIIKKTLITELNTILNPDINIIDIHPQEISDQKQSGAPKYEIYLHTSAQDDYIALSKMGTGIKTVILLLLNLIVIPEIQGPQKDKLVFGLEELENNLHPSMQRRLFNYIADYAMKYNSIFFITTHSSVVIDLFSSNKIVQLIHVVQQANGSIASTIEKKTDGRNILNDLGYKASDLLLSNGIIWVEGPSDVIYLELFMELFKKMNSMHLTKLNYTIQALSTAVWKHAGFSDFDWEKIANVQNQLISLTKVNHNHLIILDNDNNYENLLPSNWGNFSNSIGKIKAKLIHESILNSLSSENQLSCNYGDTVDGKLLFWVNEGTCETYLEYFAKNKGSENFKKYFSTRKRGYFEKSDTGVGASKSKVQLAIEISNYCFENNLTLQDFALENSALHDKLSRLFATIKSWN